MTRVLLLLSVVWLASLTRPVFSALGHEVSWRDMILLAGGLFLIFKASTEIFDEVEGDAPHPRSAAAGFAMVIAQIVVLDMVFSLDSIITAIGIATHPEVMVAAIVVSVLLMMVASGPIADFVAAHPSTKMLALAFLVMVGMALVADGFGVHVERGFIYAAMLFSGAVEALNLWRAKRRARARAQNRSEDG